MSTETETKTEPVAAPVADWAGFTKAIDPLLKEHGIVGVAIVALTAEKGEDDKATLQINSGAVIPTFDDPKMTAELGVQMARMVSDAIAKEAARAAGMAFVKAASESAGEEA